MGKDIKKGNNWAKSPRHAQRNCPVLGKQDWKPQAGDSMLFGKRSLEDYNKDT